jgi:glycosyltransferase involved in cell wall biosynthesis
MNRTVSVVIPTYERPEFLRGAITTAVEQTYDDVEVIVVDDGSSESYAPGVVDDFPETVNCIPLPENQGLSTARNTGIEAASGDYVAFLDDDDRWHRTKLAKQVQKIERSDGIGLVTCALAAFTPDLEVIHCEQTAPSGDLGDRMLISNVIGTPSRVLVRTDAIDDTGPFDESLATKQDWDFYLRLCQKYRVGSVDDVLCFRRAHESMSGSPKANIRDNKTILDKHEQLIRNRGFWRQAVADLNARGGRAHLHAGNLPKAKRYLWAALRQEPSKRRGILFLLALTHPRLVCAARRAKREFVVRFRGCDDIDFSSESIPAIDEPT